MKNSNRNSKSDLAFSKYLAYYSVVIFSTTSCGFLVQKEGNIKKSGEESVKETPPIVGPQSDNQNPAPQNTNTNSAEVSPSPDVQGDGSTSNSTPQTGPNVFETVQDGGTRSGLLASGAVYFAPGESIFYNFSYEITDNQMKINGNTYFKESAPDGSLKSYLHAGKCEDTSSKRYQHIAGDTTPGTSELHVELVGTELKKSGTGVGQFVPREEELSYVIEFEEKRLCMPIGIIKAGTGTASSTSTGSGTSTNTGEVSTTPSPTPATSPAPTPAVIGPVTDGGTVTGLLANGTPYFAGADSIYYTFNYRTSGSSSTLTGDIYFKSNAPVGDLMSHLHEGTCADTASARYQHIAGDSTAGSSELHVTLAGTTRKTGSTTVAFVPRQVPLSYVIQYEGKRLCADFKTSNTTTSTTPTTGTTTTVTDAVIKGGNVSGLLTDGTPYFAGFDEFFYKVKFNTVNNVTTVNGEIYFKNPGPTADLKSHVHAGSCDSMNAPHYQHIAGNSTPETSELHVTLNGSATVKKGTGKGNFAFRKEPLSYVIQNGTERLCTNIVMN